MRNWVAEAAPCPRPGASPASLRIGSVRQCGKSSSGGFTLKQVLGPHEKRTPWGIKRSQRRNERATDCHPQPKLQIVPLELWHEGQERWRNVRRLYLHANDGRLHGLPWSRIALPLDRLHRMTDLQGQPVHSKSEPW
jgi:hypothetical protein